MKLLQILLLTTFFTLLNADLLQINNDIIKDTKTNFLWQDNNDVKSIKMNFNDALNYCKELKVDNKKNWKLPGFMELFSIVNTKSYKPALSKEFKYFVSDNYWTSKTFGNATSGEAFVIDFLSGAFNRKLMDEKFYVRCYQ